MAKRQKTTGRGSRSVRKKNVIVESNGHAFIRATFNNVIVTMTDQYGNTISWASSGKQGFKGSRKNTPYAAQVAASAAAKEAYDLGLRRGDGQVKRPGAARESEVAARQAVESRGPGRVKVHVKRPCTVRYSAFRALSATGLEFPTIRDVTPIPHNGCRPPKRRRV